jgi:replicative DNA helicase
METLIHNPDAEKAIIGAILITNGKCLDDINIQPDDFHELKLGKLFKLCRTMHLNGEGVDAITVAAHPDFAELAVHSADLFKLTDYTISTGNVEYYANLVYEAAVRRRVIDASSKIIQDAEKLDFSYLTETARKRLDDAVGVKSHSISFIGDEISHTIDAMQQPSKAYPTPWALLTKAIGGFRAGSLYTIGARPGKGKTSIGLQCAMTLSRNGAVAFASLEMGRMELHKRIISIGASIPMDSTMNNTLSQSEWERLARFKEEIRPNIAIDDRAEVSIHDIRAFARSVHRVMPLKGVIVDYLQLMSSKDNRPRHEIVAEMSRQLKILARDLEVPVIALSQLNRNSELRTDKRPSLADLRESGAIEQDSDVVILLHQEEDLLLLDIAKNRQGAPALVKLRWEGEYARAVS